MIVNFPDTARLARIEQAFERLAADLAKVRIGGPGAHGIRRSLEQKLANAQRKADQGSEAAAAGLLRAFIQEVQRLPTSRITTADRERLVTAASRALSSF